MNLPNKPKVLASTYNPISNTKMISFLVDFPTVLLAELRTHRILTQGSLYEHSELVDFNLSANSARAIPHNKYLQKILDNPFIPIWTKQQSGMSGEIIIHNPTLNDLDEIWGISMSDTEECYNELIKEKVHKANANRLLSPFAYTTCIISGTEFENFFELRCPKYHTPVSGEGFYAKSKKELLSWHSNQENIDKLQDSNFDWNKINKSTAQPEFQIISEMLYDLYQEAEWEKSKYHIPFEEEISKLYHNQLDLIAQGNDEIYVDLMLKVSASRCAKLSYNTQDNEDTLEKHLERAEMLIEHKHQEPFSHQAVAMSEDEYENMFNQSIVNVNGKKERKREMGVAYNLRGFISQRYILENY